MMTKTKFIDIWLNTVLMPFPAGYHGWGNMIFVTFADGYYNDWVKAMTAVAYPSQNLESTLMDGLQCCESVPNRLWEK